jgi:hypothetical protein
MGYKNSVYIKGVENELKEIKELIQSK